MSGIPTNNVNIGGQSVGYSELAEPKALGKNASKTAIANHDKAVQHVNDMKAFLADGELTTEEIEQIAMFDGNAALSATDFELGGLTKKTEPGFKVSEASIFFQAAQAKISTESGDKGINQDAFAIDRKGHLEAGATAQGFGYRKGTMSHDGKQTLKSLQNDGGLVTKEKIESFVGTKDLTATHCKQPPEFTPDETKQMKSMNDKELSTFLQSRGGGDLYNNLVAGGFSHTQAVDFCTTTANALEEATIKVATGEKPEQKMIQVDDKTKPIYGPPDVTKPTSEKVKEIYRDPNLITNLGGEESFDVRYTVPTFFPVELEATIRVDGKEVGLGKSEIAHNMQLANKPIVDKFTVTTPDPADPTKTVKELDYCGFHATITAAFPGANFTEDETADMLNLMQSGSTAADTKKLVGYLRRMDGMNESPASRQTRDEITARNDKAGLKEGDKGYIRPPQPDGIPVIRDDEPRWYTDGKVEDIDFPDEFLDLSRLQGMVSLNALIAPATGGSIDQGPLIGYEKKSVPDPADKPKDPGKTVSLDFTFEVSKTKAVYREGGTGGQGPNWLENLQGHIRNR